MPASSSQGSRAAPLPCSTNHSRADLLPPSSSPLFTSSIFSTTTRQHLALPLQRLQTKMHKSKIKGATINFGCMSLKSGPFLLSFKFAKFSTVNRILKTVKMFKAAFLTWSSNRPAMFTQLVTHQFHNHGRVLVKNTKLSNQTLLRQCLSRITN